MFQVFRTCKGSDVPNEIKGGRLTCRHGQCSGFQVIVVGCWLFVKQVRSLGNEEFSVETALEAAAALHRVLAARTHRRTVMGQDVFVAGQLGDALHLPQIIRRLQAKQARQRDRGLEDFQELWPTLSPATRAKVLHNIGWYDPKSLDWDDKRSNRRPITDTDL